MHKSIILVCITEVSKSYGHAQMYLTSKGIWISSQNGYLSICFIWKGGILNIWCQIPYIRRDVFPIFSTPNYYQGTFGNMRNPLPLSAFPQTKKSRFFLAHQSARKPGQRSISFVEGFPCPNPRFHLRKEICGFSPRIFIVTKCGSLEESFTFPLLKGIPHGNI